MALDTYPTIWRAVLLRCPAASSFLAQSWVRNSFRRVGERRRWSWLVKRSQFLLNAIVHAGTVTVTRLSPNVVGDATAAAAFSGQLVGRQFRLNAQTPIYTITAVTTTSVANDTLVLDDVWGGTTTSGQGYQVYNVYVTVPSDFHSFVSVIDPQNNWQLWTQVQQDELNVWDAQRASVGFPYIVASALYDTTSTPPLPRYEMWPHQQSNYVYPFLYEARFTDLDDANATLPRFIRGDMLMEMALAEAARWPGPSKELGNPYFNLQLASMHDLKAEQMIMEAERQDDEVFEADLRYATINLPYAPLPWADAAFLQSHGI